MDANGSYIVGDFWENNGRLQNLNAFPAMGYFNGSIGIALSGRVSSVALFRLALGFGAASLVAPSVCFELEMAAGILDATTAPQYWVFNTVLMGVASFGLIFGMTALYGVTTPKVWSTKRPDKTNHPRV